MQKLSRTSSGKNNKSCSTLHHESNKIGFAFFLIFLRFSTEFTRISKTHVLFEMGFCTEVPGKLFRFTSMPVVRVKLPVKKEGGAIGSLAMEGGGSGRNPANWRRGWPEKRAGKRLGTHQGSIWVLGWGRRGCRRGGPRLPAAAAAGAPAPVSLRPRKSNGRRG
jgi:hypothetical protein